jgi:uncharacterized protein YbjT (DUF2867 family)
MARHPEYMRQRVGADTEILAGDVMDPASLTTALEGVSAAFYLVHSMGGEAEFQEADRIGARNFAAAALAAGVKRLIYLGGLGGGEELSSHLDSRQEVGRILRESGVPTIEFRASIIVGSGSVSFEMIRALVDRLPVMIMPKWVSTRTQPIGIEDVVAYLQEALTIPLAASTIFEIGGPDIVSYADLMDEYARQRGLARAYIPVPVLTPHLSSLWLALVTPVYARVGRALIEGLRHETLVRDDSARRAFAVVPRGLKEAMARTLVNEDRRFAATRWSDATSSIGHPRGWGGMRLGTRLVDARHIDVAVPPAAAFAPIRRIGGKTGWYHATLLWRMRGWLDLLFGGAGLRRGRRDPEQIACGDTLDFWRVESIEPDHLLRLSAEMRLPGRAWLQFEVEPKAGGSTIHQTAIFDPAGVVGQIYWYMLWPLHQYVFGGMLRALARAALAEGGRTGGGADQALAAATPAPALAR